MATAFSQELLEEEATGAQVSEDEASSEEYPSIWEAAYQFMTTYGVDSQENRSNKPEGKDIKQVRFASDGSQRIIHPFLGVEVPENIATLNPPFEDVLTDLILESEENGDNGPTGFVVPVKEIIEKPNLQNEANQDFDSLPVEMQKYLGSAVNYLMKTRNRTMTKFNRQVKEFENFFSNNFSTVGINTPNLQSVVIYANKPDIKLLENSKNETPVRVASVGQSPTNNQLPIYPPLTPLDLTQNEHYQNDLANAAPLIDTHILPLENENLSSEEHSVSSSETLTPEAMDAIINFITNTFKVTHQNGFGLSSNSNKPMLPILSQEIERNRTSFVNYSSTSPTDVPSQPQPSQAVSSLTSSSDHGILNQKVPGTGFGEFSSSGIPINVGNQLPLTTGGIRNRFRFPGESYSVQYPYAYSPLVGPQISLPQELNALMLLNGKIKYDTNRIAPGVGQPLLSFVSSHNQPIISDNSGIPIRNDRLWDYYIAQQLNNDNYPQTNTYPYNQNLLDPSLHNSHQEPPESFTTSSEFNLWSNQSKTKKKHSNKQDSPESDELLAFLQLPAAQKSLLISYLTKNADKYSQPVEQDPIAAKIRRGRPKAIKSEKDEERDLSSYSKYDDLRRGVSKRPEKKIDSSKSSQNNRKNSKRNTTPRPFTKSESLLLRSLLLENMSRRYYGHLQNDALEVNQNFVIKNVTSVKDS